MKKVNSRCECEFHKIWKPCEGVENISGPKEYTPFRGFIGISLGYSGSGLQPGCNHNGPTGPTPIITGATGCYAPTGCYNY